MVFVSGSGWVNVCWACNLLRVVGLKVVDKVEDADFPVDIKVGISDIEHEQFNRETSVLEAIGRTMPLWLTVVLLILTRLEFVGLKDAGKLQDHGHSQRVSKSLHTQINFETINFA